MTEVSTALPPVHSVQRRSWLWAGWIASALPVLGMLFSGVVKLTGNLNVIEVFTGKFGYPPQTLVPIGIVEIACVVLYSIPQTAVLGAILTTTYLGGAVATHLRVQDPFFPPIVFGILVWLGLYLRDERIRRLLPLRRNGLQG
jgi:DoxX-like protein